MAEYLYYLELNGNVHFIHEHLPEEVKESPYIFFNPIFDEKKRSQRFYAETARGFCNKGIPVIRFDYYGTGDSYGQLFEMALKDIKHSAINLINKIKGKYHCSKINLLGLRMGADIAMHIIESYSEYINTAFLIEPIINGKHYLLEQRARRKMFYKINNMINMPETIIIEGKPFEDHQGYPISEENLNCLNNLNSTEIKFSGKNVTLVKLNTISSKKTMNQLKEKIMENNSVLYYNFDCPDFWSIPEAIDTNSLSDYIISKV